MPVLGCETYASDSPWVPASVYSKLYTVPGSGSFTIDSVQEYFKASGAGVTGRTAVYGSDGNLRCEGSATFSVSTDVGWQGNTTFTGTATLVAGASYRICNSFTGANCTLYYTAGSAGDGYYLDGANYTAGWPATLPGGFSSVSSEFSLRINYTAIASATIEQEGFRFRNDDGSESAATWKANQDTNITLAADTAFRLRFLLKATGNPDSIDAQAEARIKPSGGAFGSWEKIN